MFDRGPVSTAPGDWLLRALSHLAPGAAARLAERRFLTPPRHAVPDHERQMLDRGRRGRLDVAGRRLATWTWGAGPAVLLVHGWGGRGGQLGAFVPPLVGAGFRVVAFDAPAHGASEGRLTTMPDIARAVRSVGEALGPVRGILGHSGGAAASAWALRRWLLDGVVEGVEAVALIAPPAGFGAYLDAFAAHLGLSADSRARLRRRLEARLGQPFDAFDLPRLVAEFPHAALVVHDREDAEVPWSDGAAIAAAWPGAELVTTRGLGHRRILRDPGVLARVRDFLAARLAGHEAPAGSRHAMLC